MLLAVNVGNTHIRMGIWDGEQWKLKWNLRSEPYRSADEYRLLVGSLLIQEGMSTKDVNQGIIASVVPGVTADFTRALKEICGVEPVSVNPSLPSRVTIGTDNPGEVGADLYVNAVAAYEKTGGACIVVDFGTALSFTAVDGNGVVQGVSIAPGITSALKGLVGDTAQLFAVDLSVPEQAIGKNTTASIQSGIVFGYKGLVEEIVGRMKEELGGTAACIATGGYASLIAPLCGCIDTVDPAHTLMGLLTLYRYQKSI